MSSVCRHVTLPTVLLRIILARSDFTPLTAGSLLAAAAPTGWGRDATFLYKRADGREVDSGDPAIVGGMPWSEQRYFWPRIVCLFVVYVCVCISMNKQSLTSIHGQSPTAYRRGITQVFCVQGGAVQVLCGRGRDSPVTGRLSEMTPCGNGLDD